jgi:nitroimidazol reductase NimA-like FMN-containing flavoprotein (pyridoxamine 5'-phosphate oxidase superfamily)
MPSERTTLRRVPDRGRYDRDTIDGILDEAYLCHVGLVDPEGRPFVIPTIHARDGDVVYVHGSPASRALRTGTTGVDCCLAVTLLDGLVLARSTFHHSMNYRSAVLYGRAERVDDVDEKRAALDVIVEHVVRGRSTGARQPNDKELKGTLVLRLPIDEASAKVRTGGPIDDEEDYAITDVWAGVVPLTVTPGAPQPDEGITVEWPGYDLRRVRRGAG